MHRVLHAIVDENRLLTRLGFERLVAELPADLATLRDYCPYVSGMHRGCCARLVTRTAPLARPE